MWGLFDTWWPQHGLATCQPFAVHHILFGRHAPGTCPSSSADLVPQMEALQQQWENTTKQMEGVSADTRKMKRSVTRIQNAQEVGALAWTSIRLQQPPCPCAHKYLLSTCDTCC
jgi:hypothetical protein